MHHIPKAWLLFVSLGLCGLVFSHEVCATLGQYADSIESDARVLSAVQRSARHLGPYSVHEVDSVSVKVREYVSPTGVVFAIAWNGLIHPDLTPLLGSFNSQYKEALSATPRQHGVRRLRVKAADVVVEKWGHMRNLQARAYAPALIPRGVSTDELR